MPIYEYDCQKCGTFETTQKITEKPLSKCPTCKGKVKKLISNTSFQLKGTGWYVTDYASSGNGRKDSEKKESDKKEAAKESKTDKQPASDSTGKTDFKPASTTSSKPEKK